MADSPGRRISFDGASLSLDPGGGGRSFLADEHCLAGEGEPRGWASVCASTDPDAAVPFDAPEVQHARREAYAWWIPLLGDDLICLTTLALDGVRCAGAITVVNRERDLADDPFARLFPATVVEAPGLFTAVAPPPGPVVERYAGHPWPGGRF